MILSYLADNMSKLSTQNHLYLVKKAQSQTKFCLDFSKSHIRKPATENIAQPMS